MLERQTEASRHGTDHLVVFELCRHHARGGNALALQFVEQRLHQRGLAGAHASGNHHKAFALLHAIAQERKRLAVSLARIEEPGVGRELERTTAEFVELFVHVRVFQCLSDSSAVHT